MVSPWQQKHNFLTLQMPFPPLPWNIDLPKTSLKTFGVNQGTWFCTRMDESDVTWPGVLWEEDTRNLITQIKWHLLTRNLRQSTIFGYLYSRWAPKQLNQFGYMLTLVTGSVLLQFENRLFSYPFIFQRWTNVNRFFTWIQLCWNVWQFITQATHYPSKYQMLKQNWL